MSSLYPPQAVGGYEQACADVVAWWRSRGHDVMVLTSDTIVDPSAGSDGRGVDRSLRLGDPPPPALAPRRRQLPGIEVHNHRALHGALRSFRPAVVSVWHMGGLSLSLLRHLQARRRRVVLMVCDDWPVYAPPADALARAVGPLGRWVLPELEDLGTVVFCSDSLRRRVASATGWNLGEAGVSWLGVSPEDFPARRAQPRRWRWRLLFVGRLTPAKGVQTLVRAMVHLPDEASLTVLGTARDDEVRALQALANEVGCGDRVSIAQRPRATLAEAYDAADVLVFPSEWEEPFGIVPLEAMACGTPVVATGTGGSGEYLRDGEDCVLFEPGDPVALAAAVRRLAEDPALRAALVQHGGHQAATITTHRLAEDLEAIHRRAAGGQPS